MGISLKRKEYKLKWKKDNKEVLEIYHKNYNREYYRKNKLKCKELTKSWVLRNPDRVKKIIRKAQLRYYYGITPQTYDEMLLNQNGVCKICGKSPGKNRLCVDHSHSTKVVRGLLCFKCNRGLGMFNDTPEILEKALTYLKESL